MASIASSMETRTVDFSEEMAPDGPTAMAMLAAATLLGTSKITTASKSPKEKSRLSSLPRVFQPEAERLRPGPWDC